jgi:hypothetical protein
LFSTKIQTFVTLQQTANQMKLKNPLTVKEYADKYGLSVFTLYKQIHSGLLKYEKRGSVYLVEDQKPAYKQTGRRGKLQG